MTPLEKELDAKLRALYHQWQTIGYRANYFWRMLTSENPRYGKGPVNTVKHLLVGEPSVGSGFMRLRKAGKLSLPVEALLIDPKWTRLFTSAELEKAKARLARYGSN